MSRTQCYTTSLHDTHIVTYSGGFERHQQDSTTLHTLHFFALPSFTSIFSSLTTNPYRTPFFLRLQGGQGFVYPVDIRGASTDDDQFNRIQVSRQAQHAIE